VNVRYFKEMYKNDYFICPVLGASLFRNIHALLQGVGHDSLSLACFYADITLNWGDITNTFGMGDIPLCNS
jgi:hypothetical protein